jgi:hypothetical protein
MVNSFRTRRLAQQEADHALSRDDEPPADVQERIHADLAAALRTITGQVGAATELRLRLAIARDHGHSFDSAWTLALSAVLEQERDSERREWWVALRETRDVWEAAYRGEGKAHRVKLDPALLELDEPMSGYEAVDTIGQLVA